MENTASAPTNSHDDSSSSETKQMLKAAMEYNQKAIYEKLDEIAELQQENTKLRAGYTLLA